MLPFYNGARVGIQVQRMKRVGERERREGGRIDKARRQISSRENDFHFQRTNYSARHGARSFVSAAFANRSASRPTRVPTRADISGPERKSQERLSEGSRNRQKERLVAVNERYARWRLVREYMINRRYYSERCRRDS